MDGFEGQHTDVPMCAQLLPLCVLEKSRKPRSCHSFVLSYSRDFPGSHVGSLFPTRRYQVLITANVDKLLHYGSCSVMISRHKLRARILFFVVHS